MAVNTVSTISYDNWQLINTVSTTSGSSVTVATGISGYKRFLFVWSGVGQGTAVNLLATFNASATNYAAGAISAGTTANLWSTTNIPLDSYSTTSGRGGYIYIENVLAAAPKTWNGWAIDDSIVSTLGGVWNNTSAITSVEIKLSGGTFNAGSASLYGIAA
jgi:hypothetical protein